MVAKPECTRDEPQTGMLLRPLTPPLVRPPPAYKIHPGTYTFRVGATSRTDVLAANVTLPAIAAP